MREVLCLDAWTKQDDNCQEDAECTEDDSLSVTDSPVDDPCISI